MIQIENSLISFEVFTKHFCCNLSKCKGVCCIDGDSGAPLEECEVERIRSNYENIKIYMKPAGIEAVEAQGHAVIDRDGDLGTTLIDERECAYTIDENGSCWCAIEKAWTEGKSDFRKPISCHLYPIRITTSGELDLLNYSKWDVCDCALLKGRRKGMPLYLFLKEALTEKYGLEWYQQLLIAAKEIESGNIIIR